MLALAHRRERDDSRAERHHDGPGDDLREQTFGPAAQLGSGSLLAVGGYEIRPAVPTAPGLSSRIERQHLDYFVDPVFLPREEAAAITYFVKAADEMDHSDDGDGAAPTPDTALVAALVKSTTTRARTLRALGLNPAVELDLSVDLVGAMLAPSLVLASRSA